MSQAAATRRVRPNLRRARVVAAVIAAGSLALTACSTDADNAADEESTSPQPSLASPSTSESAAPSCDPAQTVADWPLPKRVGQLLFAGIYTNDGPYAITVAEQAVADGVGGLNFLGTEPGIYADGELEAVSQAGTIPPFLAIDQEGGRVQRLEPLIGDVPSARKMGAEMTAKEIQKQAEDIGEAMADLNLNMDLAPVVDVSSQPDDSVAGDRSFSDRPDEVTADAGAFVKGLQSQGIVPVLKHFPGLGSATGNTDFEPATTPPLEELKKKDLRPYERLTKQAPIAVMMSSAVVPGLTNGEQAGLSKPAVDLLRKDYKFDGVIMTDSLSGVAVRSQFELPEAAERAIAAGVDMVLWDSTAEIGQVRQRLVNAVRNDRLDGDQINASVLRVLELKDVDACALGEADGQE